MLLLPAAAHASHRSFSSTHPACRITLLGTCGIQVTPPQQSPAPSSSPAPATCSDGFRAWLGSVQTCDPRTNPSTCCAPLLGLGVECIGSVYESARASADQQTLEAM